MYSKRINRKCQFVLVLLTMLSSFTFADNKGGSLLVTDIKAWRCNSLTYDGGMFKIGPIIGTLTPKKGNSFIIVSAKIDIDWTGFPDATQYFLDTREIKLRTNKNKAEYQPFGSYKMGGKYEEMLSTHLYPQKERDTQYYLDIVFCVPLKEGSDFTFCTAETETKLTLQENNAKIHNSPATFEIIEVKFIDQLPSLVDELFGYYAQKAKDDYDFSIRPIWGKFLSLSLKITADNTDFYGVNQEGLYTKDKIIIPAHEISILIPERGYFPAVAMLSGEEVKVLSTRYRDKENSVFTYTLLFCVPENIASFDLLYKKQPVIKKYTVK